jgi:hypothetical protein
MNEVVPHRTSLPAIPELQKGRLFGLERLAYFLKIVLNFYLGCFPVFLQEGQSTPAEQRDKSLHNVIASNHGSMVGGGKFVDCSCPERAE